MLGLTIGLLLLLALMLALVPGVSGALVAWAALGVLAWFRPEAVPTSALWLGGLAVGTSWVGMSLAPVVGAGVVSRHGSPARGALVGSLLGWAITPVVGSLSVGAAGMVMTAWWSGPWRARVAALVGMLPALAVTVLVDMLAVVSLAAVIAVCDAGAP